MLTWFDKLSYLTQGYRVKTIADFSKNCEVLQGVELYGVHGDIKAITDVEYDGIDSIESYYLLTPRCSLKFINRHVGFIDNGVLLALGDMPTYTGKFDVDFYIDKRKFKHLNCKLEDLRVTYIYNKRDMRVYLNTMAYNLVNEESKTSRIIDQTEYLNTWDYFALSNSQPIMKTIEMMDKSIRSNKRSLIDRIFSFFSFE